MVSIGMVTVGCGTDTVCAAEEVPQTAIQKMLDIEQAAWNAGDSITYANEYTVDADFINIRGQVFEGRKAVQQQHERIFAGPFNGSSITIVVRKLVLLAKATVLVDTDQTVISFKGLPPGIVATAPGVLVTHFKYLAIQQTDGTWKFASGQNTAALPTLAVQQTMMP